MPDAITAYILHANCNVRMTPVVYDLDTQTPVAFVCECCGKAFTILKDYPGPDFELASQPPLPLPPEFAGCSYHILKVRGCSACERG
jgi:hypothetical protein